MGSHTFHMGNKGHSINNSNNLSSSFNHNLRKYKNEKNYSREDNFVLVNKASSVKEYKKYFNNLFKAEVEKYNQGKKPCRKIKNYYQHCCEKKNTEIAVELILQSEDMYYWKDKTKETRMKMADFYKEQLQYLQELMPELEVVNAVVHNDENSPHMHVIAIPVATGYTRGLGKRCSKTKVFTDKLEMLQDKLRTKAEELMRKHIDPNYQGFIEKQEGRNYDLSKAKYKEIYERTEKEIRNELTVKLKPEIALELRNELQSSLKLSEKEISKAKNEKIAEYKSSLDENKIRKEVFVLYKKEIFEEYDYDEKVQDNLYYEYVKSNNLELTVNKQLNDIQKMQRETADFLYRRFKIAEAYDLMKRAFSESLTTACQLNTFAKTLINNENSNISEFLLKRVKALTKMLANRFKVDVNLERDDTKQNFQLQNKR